MRRKEPKYRLIMEVNGEVHFVETNKDKELAELIEGYHNTVFITQMKVYANDGTDAYHLMSEDNKTAIGFGR